MPVGKIAEVTFTSADRVRDVIHNFNADGFDSLYPKYAAEDLHPAWAPGDQEDRQDQAGRARPAVLDLEPGQAGRLPGRRGLVDVIGHGGLRVLLREEGVSFQRIKTWKTPRDPDYSAKKARVEQLYGIADGEVIPEDSEPEVVLCLDEFGSLNLQPHPGRQWAERGGRQKPRDREPRRRRRATYNRPAGARHLFAAYYLAKDKLYGYIKKTKNRPKFLEFCRYLRTPYPLTVRLAIVCASYSAHLITMRCRRAADWAEANNVEVA